MGANDAPDATAVFLTQGIVEPLLDEVLGDIKIGSGVLT